MSMKNSNDIIGNRTRDLPACSAVPQTTAPPRVPLLEINTVNTKHYEKKLKYVFVIFNQTVIKNYPAPDKEIANK